MPSLVVIGPQIKEKRRGAQCAPPAYMVPKDPSLNRVKAEKCIFAQNPDAHLTLDSSQSGFGTYSCLKC